MSRVASAVLAEPPGPRPEKLPGCATDRARGARCALLWGGGAVPAAGWQPLRPAAVWRGGACFGVAGWRGGARGPAASVESALRGLVYFSENLNL